MKGFDTPAGLVYWTILIASENRVSLCLTLDIANIRQTKVKTDFMM